MESKPGNIIRPATLSSTDRTTQVFDGFPHLVVRLGPGVYCDPDGSVEQREQIPRGGTQRTGPLRLGREFVGDGELAARQERLEAYLRERNPQTGFVTGDLEKGGRPATLEERERLAETQEGSERRDRARGGDVPRGLSRCTTCGEWRGECLDPNPLMGELLVRVSCRCENANRCARCGELLDERALNANYYDEYQGRVIHVPGFVALGHRCGEQSL